MTTTPQSNQDRRRAEYAAFLAEEHAEDIRRRDRHDTQWFAIYTLAAMTVGTMWVLAWQDFTVAGLVFTAACTISCFCSGRHNLLSIRHSREERDAKRKDRP